MTQQAPQAADLCTRCGLCCDGTVFELAKAYPEDLDGLARHGLSMNTASGRLAFNLPCPRLDGATCTIYAERFVTCRRFRCQLLKGVESGDVAPEKGLATIASARTLIAAVEPEARMAHRRRALTSVTAEWHSIPDATERMNMARRHLAIVALERYLDKHFRRNKRLEVHPTTDDQPGAPNPKSAGPKACGSNSDKA